MLTNESKIIFATANPHKVFEVNEIAKGTGISFLSPQSGFNPVEDGATFLENAYKKAVAGLDGCHAVLADDSGLCVEALDGAPGVYSARYAATQGDKIQKLLESLDGVQNRKAKFVCAMVLLAKNGDKLFESVSEVCGEISKSPKGTNGFGYDPIFIVENTGVSMAQMSEADKNRISHRACALQNVIFWLSGSNNKKLVGLD